MSKDMLKSLIELVPEEDIKLLCRNIIRFILEAVPEQGEIEAILEGQKNGTISHDAINWD